MFTVRKSGGVRVLQKNSREESSPNANWPFDNPRDWSKPSQEKWWLPLSTPANQVFYSKKVTELVERPQAQKWLGVWEWFYWLKWFTGETLRTATVNMVNASLYLNGRR